MKRAIPLITALGLVIGVSGVAHADLITNGSFSNTTNINGTNPQVNSVVGNGQLGYNTTVTGWSVPSNSYAFVYADGTATSTGATGNAGNVKLAGPIPASPNGGNFLASDGDTNYHPGAISQIINPALLTVNTSYTLSFYYAAAQQTVQNGPTTSWWDVSFGGSTLSTNHLSIVSHGFSGWQQESFNFVYNGNNNVLSFLAHGTPTGTPPFSLLDGVSLNATTPEGSSLGLFSMGLLSMGGVGAFARRKKAAKSVS